MLNWCKLKRTIQQAGVFVCFRCCISVVFFVMSTALQAKLQPDSGPGNDKTTWQREKWRRAEKRGKQVRKTEKKLKKMKGGMSEVGCMSHTNMQAHRLPITSLSYYSYKHDLIMCSEETSHTILQLHVHRGSQLNYPTAPLLYKQLAWALYLICTHLVF